MEYSMWERRHHFLYIHYWADKGLFINKQRKDETGLMEEVSCAISQLLFVTGRGQSEWRTEEARFDGDFKIIAHAIMVSLFLEKGK